MARRNPLRRQIDKIRQFDRLAREHQNAYVGNTQCMDREVRVRDTLQSKERIKRDNDIYVGINPSMRERSTDGSGSVGKVQKTRKGSLKLVPIKPSKPKAKQLMHGDSLRAHYRRTFAGGRPVLEYKEGEIVRPKK